MSFRRWLIVLPIVGAAACSSPTATPEADAGTKVDGGSKPVDGGSGADAGTVADAGWPYDCPLDGCLVEDKTCLAFADYAGEDTALLRMSQLTISKPAALTDGLLGAVVNNAILPDAADCSLNGSGNASWLMQFDTSGAEPVVKTGSGRMNAGDGSFSYIDEDVTFGGGLVPVKPKTVKVSLGEQGHFETTETADINLMVANADGSALAMLPLQGVSLKGAISQSHNCIGRYQADLLYADNACQADEETRFFEEAGTVQGFISLEAADDLFITPIQSSLCVVLSGDASKYGNGKTPVQCKRDGAGNIVYQGDWCSTTNAAAAGDCADAARLEGTFAASAVVEDVPAAE